METLLFQEGGRWDSDDPFVCSWFLVLHRKGWPPLLQEKHLILDMVRAGKGYPLELRCRALPGFHIYWEEGASRLTWT